MSEADEQVRRALSRPALERIWAVARERLERDGSRRLGSFTLGDASQAECEALAELIGLDRVPRAPLKVDMRLLDAQLASSALGVCLVEALEILAGPLGDRRGEREREASRRQEIWEQAARHPAVQGKPGLMGWLADLRRRGTLFKLDPLRPEELLRGTLDTLERLPEEDVLLGDLASRVAGHAHALDPGQPLGTLVISALAALSGTDVPADSLHRRLLWAGWGVLVDNLSCSVLVLNLRPRGQGLLARKLGCMAEMGEPDWLTLSQLQREELRFDPVPVFVCENPSVVEHAKMRLGAAGSPLVCVYGQANTAGVRILELLTACGCPVRYQGDFDWGGVRIGNHLMRLGARPWRFGRADYEEACDRLDERALPLRGRPVAASWDPELQQTMLRRAKLVHQEAMLDRLIADLTW